MNKIRHFVLSFAAGIAVFIGLFRFVEAGIIMSLLLGLAGLLGFFLLLSPKKFDPKLEELAKIYGITPERLKRVIKGGRKKLRQIKKLAENIEDEHVRDKIMRIYDLTKRIFENFKNDPKDIKSARQFLNYYLDTTVKIIRQYSNLLGKKTTDSDDETLKKAEEMLGAIEKTFAKQLDKLYEDDFLDLDSELKVLEKSMKFDGV